MAESKTDIRLGDCLDVLSEMPDDRFDLIVTSPPYADSRANTYGGIKPDERGFCPERERCSGS